jgi:hypothetical protein
MATKWEYLRDDVVRVQLRDESDAPVFTDAELMTYFGNAIKAYSRVIPLEVSGNLSLIADQADYDLPDDCLEIVSIKVGTAKYSVTEIFAGQMTLDPIPSTGATAVIKYRSVHTIPADEDDASSYDAIDEPLIVMHVKAQCWETLAADGAKYYEYTEGDIKENQGKTQAQFRAEADALYAKFNAGVAKSHDDLLARRASGATQTIVGVVSRKAAERSATIFKTS